ncbi:MAG: hypothetical protein M3319_12895 [Actinomycetota bacterium]|nr:hypothetical protein [Actinomycetota bacterium]MDQ3901279.1 hypothetical protein [Actinomycetota bacterium]
MRNSVRGPNATDEVNVTGDQVGRKLSAALRAQASGLGASPSQASIPTPPSMRPGRRSLHARPRPSAWAVLVLAVLLGAMAGALAGVISIW